MVGNGKIVMSWTFLVFWVSPPFIQHNDNLKRKLGVSRDIPVKCRKTKRKLPIFPGFTQGKLGICRMYSEVGKQMENTEFSRICRFVKLLVNEGFCREYWL